MADNTRVALAKDSEPFAASQGMPTYCGAGKAGLSIQQLTAWPMPSGGVLDFGDEGLRDMDISDTVYSVLIHNHTDAADEGTCLENVRLGGQLTISGCDTADVLDVVIIGTIKGQLG